MYHGPGGVSCGFTAGGFGEQLLFEREIIVWHGGVLSRGGASRWFIAISTSPYSKG
jgi:hypothetical protein